MTKHESAPKNVASAHDTLNVDLAVVHTWLKSIRQSDNTANLARFSKSVRVPAVSCLFHVGSHHSSSKAVESDTAARAHVRTDEGADINVQGGCHGTALPAYLI